MKIIIDPIKALHTSVMAEGPPYIPKEMRNNGFYWDKKTNTLKKRVLKQKQINKSKMNTSTPLPQDVVKMIASKAAELYPANVRGRLQYATGATWALTNEPLLNAAGWVRKEEVEKEYMRIDEAVDIIKIVDKDYDSQEAFEYAEFAFKQHYFPSTTKPGYWTTGMPLVPHYVSHNDMWAEFEKSRIITQPQNKQP
jgi:hypothetical protein